MLGLGLIALASFFLAPSTAPAATKVGVNGSTLVIETGFLELNNISVSRNTSGDLVVSDFVASHKTRNGAGCVQVSDRSVRCAGSVSSIAADLGGNLDIFNSSANLNTVVDGGLDKDFIDAGSGNDNLKGGTGDDGLAGRAGNDTLDGGTGDDGLEGGPGADAMIGGLGKDVVNYINQGGPCTTGVTVTLNGVPGDGLPGENDSVASDVEGVVGTSCADTLVGNSDGNRLDGANGVDNVQGLGGNDDIDVTEQSQPGTADQFSCGAGNDEALLDLVDPLLADCEDMEVAAVGQHPNVDISRGAERAQRGSALRVRLACPRKSHRRCRGGLTLQDSTERVLGRRGYRIARGEAEILEVSLNQRGRSTAASGEQIIAIARERDLQGRPKTTITQLKLGRR